MRAIPSIAVAFLTLNMAGCGVTPQTFEEALSEHRATRNDIVDWDVGMRYRVELQYASTAWLKLEAPDLEVPRDTSMDILVPFAIWDYARGDNFGGTMGFLSWFNSGLSKENTYRHYFNRGLGLMVQPNTHYFTIDDGNGAASSGDVREAWDESYELFNAVHNSGGKCQVWGYSEKHQYALTYPKDVAGRYKEVLYRCPHPLYPGETYKVYVFSYANVRPEIRAMAGIVTQCYITPPKGQSFVDTRKCGAIQAEKQRGDMTESRNGWMELVTTPKAAVPHEFEIVVRYGGKVETLPAPALKEKYQEFLKERTY